MNGGGGPKDYDAAGRRNGVEPDFSFADKVVPTHGGGGGRAAAAPVQREREREKSVGNMRVAKKKELKSHSPGAMKNAPSYQQSSNLLSKRSVKDKELSDDIRKIYKALVDMKKTLADDNKTEPNNKLALLTNMVEKSLSNRLFSGDLISDKKISTEAGDDSGDDVN